MQRSQGYVFSLIWALPAAALVFFSFSIRWPTTLHSILLLKIFCLCLAFSALVSHIYRRFNRFGLAIFSGLSSIIIFGLIPLPMGYAYWPIMMILVFVEASNLYRVSNSSDVKNLFVCSFAIVITTLPFFVLGYSQTNSMVELLNGRLHTDSLLHIATASMWKVNHAVSHGLHGLSELDYHYGSHLLMAGASSLMGISVFETYSHFFGFFCIPLLGISIISIAEEYVRSKNNTEFRIKVLLYCIIILGTGVVSPGSFLSRFALWPSFYVSESYTVSLILLFSLFSILKNGTNLFLMLVICCILGLMTITKISTGFFALGLLGSWALLSDETRWSKLWSYRWAVLLAGSIIFLYLKQLINPGMGDAHFNPFQFMGAYVNFSAPFYLKLLLFVAFHFIFCLGALLTYRLNLKSEQMKLAFPSWWLLSLLLSFVIGLGVVTLLYVQGGSGYYFSNVSMFIAMPFLISVPFLLEAELKVKIIKIMSVILIVTSIIYVPRVLISGVNTFFWAIDQELPINNFSTYIDKLKTIRDDQGTKNSLIYIPRSENEYWKHGDCRSASFIIPAISERPALYGWPSTDCFEFLCGPRFHSNGLCRKSMLSYSDEELIIEARRIGFEQVLIVTSKEIRTLR